MNHRNDGLTYSQRKRAKLNYRAEYFRHNPGLFGCIWICAYCGKPLLGMHNVVIDHIMPLNSPLGMNNRFNLVAACQKCNSEKSDKVDGRIAVGYASKVFQSVIFTIQKIFVIGFAGIWWAIQKILKALVDAFINLPLVFKIVIVAIIILIIGRLL